MFWIFFFSNTVSNLNLPEYPIEDLYFNKLRDPAIKAIIKYKDHTSITAINRVPKSKYLFNFSNVEKNEIFQEMICLDASKTFQDTNVPTKIIKENTDIFIDFAYRSINASINNADFLSLLKLANVIPVFRKDCKNWKDSYRPISIVKNISKVYERILFKQIGTLMSFFFSKLQCEFRKGYSAQQCLFNPLSANPTKWPTQKAADCLPHELLIAKLHWYGFRLNVLQVINSYLPNRRQRTKISETYSSWEEILFGVPQGSILGHHLFNSFMCDLFFIVDEIDFASYADDNTPFVSGDRLDDVLDSLEKASPKLFDWFSNNQMKANPDKCHLLTIATTSIAIKVKDNEILIDESEKLQGLAIDNKLRFINHLQKVLKIANGSY